MEGKMVMQPENNLSVSKKLLNLDIIRAVAAIMIKQIKKGPEVQEHVN